METSEITITEIDSEFTRFEHSGIQYILNYNPSEIIAWYETNFNSIPLRGFCDTARERFQNYISEEDIKQYIIENWEGVELDINEDDIFNVPDRSYLFEVR